MTTSQKSDEKQRNRYSVPALDKALDVLELLAETPSSISQADISRALEKTPSEIFRTLSALEARGYIRRTNAGQYRMTLKMFELSRQHSPFEELLRVAAPVMRNLSEEVGETCHLTTVRDGEIVVLAQHESPKPLRLSAEVGSRHSALATTSGRIILASMSEDERMAFLRDYTQFSNMPEEVRNTFVTRVRAVQERGYEISDGERFVGGLDVGVLVGGPSSTVKAALIVATLRSAEGPDPERILQAVTRAGRKITRAVGLD